MQICAMRWPRASHAITTALQSTITSSMVHAPGYCARHGSILLALADPTPCGVHLCGCALPSKNTDQQGRKLRSRARGKKHAMCSLLSQSHPSHAVSD